MRFFLLLLSLVLQLNISGFANHNPQEIHVIKTHSSQKHQLSVTINRNGEYKVDCPFRYQGQYEDSETRLYYNRFRYYDCDSGNYISQDPIGLAGNNPALYGYVKDVNSWVDVFGLKNWNYHNMPDIDGFQKHHVIPKSLSEGARPHEIFKLSGYDVHDTKNVIYLPTDRANHSTRSVHNGWNTEHKNYNANIRRELDAITRRGKAENWTKQQYSDAIDKLRGDTRQGLRKGTISCH